LRSEMIKPEMINIRLLLIVILLCGCQMMALAQTSSSDEQTEPGLSVQFNTRDKAAAGKKFAWAGTWKYNSRYRPVTIKIRMLSAGRFKFDIDAMTGANMGGVTGTARIKNNRAYFDDRLSQEKDAEKFGCELLFIHHEKSLELKETQECYRYNGAGVTFAREKLLRGNTPLLEKNFVDRQVFPDLATDRKFRALVGAKDYELMLDDFHLINEDKDDTLNARIFNGCVRGICPSNAAIIMFDDQGHFWAAVKVFPEKPKNADGSYASEIHYYTNVSRWAGKVPPALEAWGAVSTPENPVRYMSKVRPLRRHGP
jgi:hypothetical protein